MKYSVEFIQTFLLLEHEKSLELMLELFLIWHIYIPPTHIAYYYTETYGKQL